MTTHLVPLDSIHILAQSREDYGPIERLAEDIAEHGLLHPLTVRRNGEGFIVIAGQRRLLALKMLAADHPGRYTQIEVKVVEVDEDEAVYVQASENGQRKDLTDGEALDKAKELLEIEQRRAKERKLAGLPVAETDKGRATERVAAKVGRTRYWLERALGLERQVEREPEEYGDLIANLHSGGRVEQAAQEADRREQAQAGAPLPLPPGEPVDAADVGGLARMLVAARIEEEVAWMRVRNGRRFEGRDDLREFYRRRNVSQSRLSELWAALGGNEEEIAVAIQQVNG